MTRLAGWVLAGGLLLGLASSAQAQITIGNPYTGPSISIGNTGFGNYGYGNPYGYGAYGTPYGYGTGWGMPGTSYYSSGYSGFYGAPMTRSYTATTYSYPSYGYSSYSYPYGGYGYGGYGYGSYSRRIGIPGIGRILRRW